MPTEGAVRVFTGTAVHQLTSLVVDAILQPVEMIADSVSQEMIGTCNMAQWQGKVVLLLSDYKTFPQQIKLEMYIVRGTQSSLEQIFRHLHKCIELETPWK